MDDKTATEILMKYQPSIRDVINEAERRGYLKGIEDALQEASGRGCCDVFQAILALKDKP